VTDNTPRPRDPDPIWEHKRGKIWILVRRLTQENEALRYQVNVLQARARGVSR